MNCSPAISCQHRGQRPRVNTAVDPYVNNPSKSGSRNHPVGADRRVCPRNNTVAFLRMPTRRRMMMPLERTLS